MHSGDSIYLPFLSASRDCLQASASGPLHLQCQQSLLPAITPSPCLNLSFGPPSDKDPCDCLGPVQIMQDNLPISRVFTESHQQIPFYVLGSKTCVYLGSITVSDRKSSESHDYYLLGESQNFRSKKHIRSLILEMRKLTHSREDLYCLELKPSSWLPNQMTYLQFFCSIS